MYILSQESEKVTFCITWPRNLGHMARGSSTTTIQCLTKYTSYIKLEGAIKQRATIIIPCRLNSPQVLLLLLIFFLEQTRFPRLRPYPAPIKDGEGIMNQNIHLQIALSIPIKMMDSRKKYLHFLPDQQLYLAVPLFPGVRAA